MATRTSASAHETAGAGAAGAGATGATGATGASGALSTPSDGKLPLAEDFFTVPQLSPKEGKYLLGLAKHACKEVVYYSRRAGGPMQWVHLASEDGVEVFQGVDASATNVPTAAGSSALTYLRGSCRIHASLDEIADFFKLDTADKLAGFAQTVGKDLLDQKTLLTLATPTPENPKHYVAVKWTAVESPSKLARNRDFCYLESHDEFIDTQSRKRGWVRSIHSIRLPFCPPLRKSHGLVRGSFYRSGFIFIESSGSGGGGAGGSYVDAIHTLHLDIKGHAPMWVKLLVMKRRIKNIAQVNAYFQMRRLARGPRLLGEFELPAKNGVARCQLCETKFKLFNRKWRCRKCGRVVCTNCGHHFLIDSATIAGSNAFITASGSGSGNGLTNANITGAGGANNAAGQLKKVRICVQCSENVVFGDGADDTAATANGSSATASNAAESAAERAHMGKRVEESIRPVYDESPSSSVATENPLDSTHRQHHHTDRSASFNPHQFSLEENEYYAANEDAAGIADMMEAKRMANEFEEAVLKSSQGPRGPSRSIQSNTSGGSERGPYPPTIQPRHEHEEKTRNRHLSKGEHRGQRVSADVGTTPASDASTAMSAGLRNPFNHSFELGRKDSSDSIRMSADWYNSGDESYRHPPPHLGHPVDEGHARRARVERSSGLTNSLLSPGDSPSASNSMAAAAAAAMDSGNRPSDAAARPRSPRAGYRAPIPDLERQRSQMSEDGWGYRTHRVDSGNSGDDRDFFDVATRERLISSHDPASLRRFIAQAQRSSGDKSEGNDRDNVSRGTRSLDGDVGDHGVDDGTQRRRTSEYFNARNARLAQLENSVEDLFRHYTEPTGASTSRQHRGSSGESFGSGDDRGYERRQHQRHLRSNRSVDDVSFSGRQDHDQYDPRDRNEAHSGHYQSNRGRGDSDDTVSTVPGGPDDELAQYMAMAAMRMYEQEMGPRLRVSEETKRAALRKMMAVYAQEIEQSAQRNRYGARPTDQYDEHRGRNEPRRSRYSREEAPRESRRRRGSSVDDIGDDSRSFYHHLMGVPNAPVQVPQQHSLRRSVSDQRYAAAQLRQQQNDIDRYLRDDDRYVATTPTAGDDGNVPVAGPMPPVRLGRSSIDSSSSDEDDDETRRRRRRGANSKGNEDDAAHEYRDLADISSRTFQELQIKSFGPGNGIANRRPGKEASGNATDSKAAQDASEPQQPRHRHYSRHEHKDEREADGVAGRRHNDTVVSAAEASDRDRDRVEEEDDGGSISNSYRQNDSFIGQPSPRFMRDSISTSVTANDREHRRSGQHRQADNASSSEGHRSSSRRADVMSTTAVRDTTTGGDSSGAVGDMDSASSSSMGGMALEVDRSTYGSLATSDVPRRSSSSGYYASRPNSMHEVAESDTFSEMDLAELPHLMRKEDEAEAMLRRSMLMMDRRSVGSRSSFTDLQQWEPSTGGVSSGATAPPNSGASPTSANGMDARSGRFSDLPPDRNGAAVALGMRSLGGPQHVRQFSDDSSTDSLMRGWGSEAVAAAFAPDGQSPVSSSSSIRHRDRRHNRSFNPRPTSVSSEPRLSGASGDLRASADRFRGTANFSDTSSSFYSDDGDYRALNGDFRASNGAYPVHQGQTHHLVSNPRSPSLGSERQQQQQQQQQHMHMSELRRFRKSISELLSEYSDGDAGYHQPEGEPDRERDDGEPVVPTVVVNGASPRLGQRGPAAFPSEGAAGSAPTMSRGSEKIRELFL